MNDINIIQCQHYNVRDMYVKCIACVMGSLYHSDLCDNFLRLLQSKRDLTIYSCQAEYQGCCWYW